MNVMQLSYVPTEHSTFSILAFARAPAELLHCLLLFAIPWTVAGQSPLSMGFSKQEYVSG